jgi:hypothetical protein
MASYQEMEVEINVLKDKLEFVMQSFKLVVQGIGDLVPVQKSLLELYYIMKASQKFAVTSAISAPETKEGEIIS